MNFQDLWSPCIRSLCVSRFKPSTVRFRGNWPSPPCYVYPFFEFVLNLTISPLDSENRISKGHRMINQLQALFSFLLLLIYLFFSEESPHVSSLLCKLCKKLNFFLPGQNLLTKLVGNGDPRSGSEKALEPCVFAMLFSYYMCNFTLVFSTLLSECVPSK